MDSDGPGWLLTALIFAAALLYASVGHGGASGYLAAMALVGVGVDVMRPTALVLNIVVSLVATVRFVRAGAFSQRLFWPLVLAAVPCAYVGGRLDLPSPFYKPLVGAVLVFAAWQSWRTARAATAVVLRPVQPQLLVPVGAALGLLSGLTGVGGGIFLSPLLILQRWESTRVVSGVAAAFILANSSAGLLGLLSKPAAVVLPSGLLFWAGAALVGGALGAELGSRRLANPAIQRLLALVLLVAGVKMVLTS
jgi:uncharacterized protein